MSLWLVTPLSVIAGDLSMVVLNALANAGMGTGYYQLGVAVVFYTAGLIVGGRASRWRYICVAILYLFALSHVMGFVLGTLAQYVTKS